MKTALLSTLLAASASLTFAAPPSLKRQQPNTLSTDDIAAFKDWSHFVGAVHCPPFLTGDWKCGEHCDALPGFLPVQVGGDGVTTQSWFVGFHAAINAIVVAHEGFDTNQVLPLITDTASRMTKLDSALFPGLPDPITVHGDFAKNHSAVAPQILAAVKIALKNHVTATTVALVGFSNGAPLAVLDAIYLSLHLDASIQFKVVTYSMPRMGNQDFANYVDAHFSDFRRITNKHDPTPIQPSNTAGFVHPSGEIHIQDDDSWVACPGQDNYDAQCIAGAVPDVASGKPEDSHGPYDGVHLEC